MDLLFRMMHSDIQIKQHSISCLGNEPMFQASKLQNISEIVNAVRFIPENSGNQLEKPGSGIKNHYICRPILTKHEKSAVDPFSFYFDPEYFGSICVGYDHIEITGNGEVKKIQKHGIGVFSRILNGFG